MQEHPQAEEHSSNKLAPRGISFIDRAGTAHGYGDTVGESNGDGRDEQRRPLHNVQICIDVVFVLSGRLRCQSEGNLYSGHDLEQTLEDGSKMGTRSSDDPELFVPPPLLQSDSGPSHLQDGKGAQGDGDGEKVDQEGQV